MPWRVSRNAYGCTGFAVVKEGTNEVDGCHETRAAANRQLAALHAAEGGVKKNMDLISMLTDDEKEFYDALVDIAAKYGKFNEDGTGIWAGYEPAAENEDAAMGVKCANCAFFQGGGGCQIVEFEVEEEGKCRLAAIPDGLVSWDMDEEDDDEFEDADITMSKSIWDGSFLKVADLKTDK